jgi:hypothetical protein
MNILHVLLFALFCYKIMQPTSIYTTDITRVRIDRLILRRFITWKSSEFSLHYIISAVESVVK